MNIYVNIKTNMLHEEKYKKYGSRKRVYILSNFHVIFSNL